MKLATFLHQGRESFGLVIGDGVCDVPALACGIPASLLEALQHAPETLERIGELTNTMGKPSESFHAPCA